MSLVLIVGGAAAVKNPRHFSQLSSGRTFGVTEISKEQSKAYGYVSIAAGILCLAAVAFWKVRPPGDGAKVG